jgi:cell division protein FtsB
MTRNDNIKIKFKKKHDHINLIAVIAAVALGVVVIGISTKLYATTVYATKGDDIAKRETERQRYVEMNKALETEIAKYQSVVRIEKEATERLGMVKAGVIKYIDLNNPKISSENK